MREREGEMREEREEKKREREREKKKKSPKKYDEGGHSFSLHSLILVRLLPSGDGFLAE